MNNFIKFFDELTINDTPAVGGKNSSLGEMMSKLSPKGIKIPGGFATTSEAYWEFLEFNDIKGELTNILKELDIENFSNLKQTGKKARDLILKGEFPDKISEAVKKAYKELKKKEKSLSSVAVRSSATAEDLPEASFAGQHDSFMNIKGADGVLDACRKCFASLFTDRAIKYREHNGFNHMKVALSAGVQKMVRADKASAGVIFTILPDSGHSEVIFITGAWGLGDNVVGGEVNADEFLVFKPSLRKGMRAVISKKTGSKEKMMIFSAGDGTTVNKETPLKKRKLFVLDDDEIYLLAKWALEIEEFYGRAMDIEWAKDGVSGELFIVQARPETVHGGKEKSKLKEYRLKKGGNVLVTGNGIGGKITKGTARILRSPDESEKLKEGDVLVTEITNPDWDTVMKKASAIITERGGRTSHAAIVARELGAVAVVGTEKGTEIIKDGQDITVSCAEGQTGKVYDGLLEWDEEEIDLESLGNPKTEVMLILADPEMAFSYSRYPVRGVGLLRLEFIINNSIAIHPVALLNFKEIEDKKVIKEIESATLSYTDKRKFFIDKLAEGIAMIASAFYPREVIVRMSDFKSNEYADLKGGRQFEPMEENPMLGFRGASRYYSEEYREGFAMECEAMKIVRDKMGLTNLKLMIPFCRTVEEGKKIVEIMGQYGLKQGWNDLEIYIMVELPSNVIQAEEFAEIFDGFSIGSNDLTQLVLGVDRDSALVSSLFDEMNVSVKEMISLAIQKAKKKGKKIGLCGQGPSDFAEFARFLVKEGISSISFNPDAVALGIKNILKAEGDNK
jgi:pyruvate, water dikinase